MSAPVYLALEDLVITVYAALDDGLTEAGLRAVKGKLIARRGPPPDVDDREILCLAVLQELLGIESDNAFCNWLEVHPTMRALFPRRLPRQKFAQRRNLLTPLMERLNGALCTLAGEGEPPFSSSTAILSMSAAPSERRASAG
jgi:hypothetical protein